ncbi:MAG: carboxypeptidase-like regulatory domain-containing protein, partial [Planctomycetaceae bacterium]
MNNYPSRRVVFGTVCLSLWMLTMTASAQSQESDETSDKADISGLITTEAGSAVPSARIQLWTFRDEPVRHWEPIDSPQIDQEGAFQLVDLEVPVSLLFRAESEEFAPAWSTLHLSEGGATETKIVMCDPGRVTLSVRDESGEPIAGASVRWMKIEGPNGSVSLPSHTFRDLDMARPTSDEQGLLQIDDLPSSARLTVGLLHADHAPAELKAVAIVEEGEPSTVEMKDGIPLKIRVLSDGLDEPIEEVTIYLTHQPFDHPSSHFLEQIPLDRSGRARLMIEPGSYHMLRFTHPKA